MSFSAKSTKIAIVGTEGTGKTVLLAVLANALTSTKSFPRITGENIQTRRYTAEVMDELENGKWPPSTNANVKRELKWIWHDRDGDPHELGTFDCAGQDVRIIFEAESDTELNERQRALLDEFHNCNLILLLLNLQDALNLYQKPGAGLARIDIEYAPSVAIRKLRASGITLYAVFTQADLYDERIRREWNGNYSNALRDLLPGLYNALAETGSQFVVARAVETEAIDGKIVPKKERNAADLGDIIRSVDDFFAKCKEDVRLAELVVKEAAEQERAERERLLREKEELERKRLEEENRARDEIKKQKARKKKQFLMGVVFLFVVSIVFAVFNVISDNIRREQERVQRVIREEQAAEEARKSAEEERIRKEQAEAEARKRTEEERAERLARAKQAAAEAEKRAEAERLRAEEERAERLARAKQAAAEAEKRAEAERAERQALEEQERIRAEQERIRAEEEQRIRKTKSAKFAEQIKDAGFCIPAHNIDMQPIPTGTFTMGSAENEWGHRDTERQHVVVISKPFWLGKYAITQKQWQAVMGNNPSHFRGDSLPVENVSWDDATAFCDKLTKIERMAGRLPAGYRYTLPTEAEWEYACRAGTTGPFSSSGSLEKMGLFTGSGSLETVGWFEENSGRQTHPVGLKEANAWGLYDMHGNVWEWCRDRAGDYPNGSVTDPVGPMSGTWRIHRGGCYRSAGEDCRSGTRDRAPPNSPLRSRGFRLALSSTKE